VNATSVWNLLLYIHMIYCVVYMIMIAWLWQ